MFGDDNMDCTRVPQKGWLLMCIAFDSCHEPQILGVQPLLGYSIRIMEAMKARKKLFKNANWDITIIVLCENLARAQPLAAKRFRE